MKVAWHSPNTCPPSGFPYYNLKLPSREFPYPSPEDGLGSSIDVSPGNIYYYQESMKVAYPK
jgi:hypothetical protein